MISSRSYSRCFRAARAKRADQPLFPSMPGSEMVLIPHFVQRSHEAAEHPEKSTSETVRCNRA